MPVYRVWRGGFFWLLVALIFLAVLSGQFRVAAALLLWLGLGMVVFWVGRAVIRAITGWDPHERTIRRDEMTSRTQPAVIGEEPAETSSSWPPSCSAEVAGNRPPLSDEELAELWEEAAARMDDVRDTFARSASPEFVEAAAKMAEDMMATLGVRDGRADEIRAISLANVAEAFRENARRLRKLEEGQEALGGGQDRSELLTLLVSCGGETWYVQAAGPAAWARLVTGTRLAQSRGCLRNYLLTVTHEARKLPGGTFLVDGPEVLAGLDYLRTLQRDGQ